MKPGKNSQPTEEISEEIQDKNTLSIDEFFKQLEAKEKDLDISAEMVIEIDGTDFDEDIIPHFIVAESLSEDRKVNEIDSLVSDTGSENTLSTLKNKV